MSHKNQKYKQVWGGIQGQGKRQELMGIKAVYEYIWLATGQSKRPRLWVFEKKVLRN